MNPRKFFVGRAIGFIIVLAIVAVVIMLSSPDKGVKTLEYRDLIRLTSPLAEEEITSPLVIKGEARGNWYFEATFPVVLTNWDGLIIAEGYATAQDDWMTEDYVPFEATLEFDKPKDGERGSLILKKSNASGLPEHDDALEIKVFFK